MGHGKRERKRGLKKKYDREYQKMVQEKRGDYASWIRQQEKEASGPVFDSKGIMVFSYDVMGDAAAFFTILENEAPEIVILVKKPEEMTKGAVKRIGQAFLADHVLQLLYTDEDELAEGSRINPWLKPDFSPET